MGSLIEMEVRTMAKKYDSLINHLLACKGNRLQFTLKQIEKIIGDSLPPSAYYLRQWWENSKSSSRRHVQAIAWISAGWEVDKIDFNTQQVFFRKVI